jgi:hypothetical protein
MNRQKSLIVLIAAACVALLDISHAASREPEAVNSNALYKPRIIVTTDLGADPDDDDNPWSACWFPPTSSTSRA